MREIPVGVERVLYEAAMDPEFRQALLRDREGAVRARGLELKTTELAMLRMIPEDQLVAAIDGIDLSPTNVERRTFLKTVAATSATVAVVSGCGDDTDTSMGIRPEDLGPPGMDSTGIRPDWAPSDGPVDSAPKDDIPKDAAPKDAAPDDSKSDNGPSSDMASFGMRPNG